MRKEFVFHLLNVEQDQFSKLLDNCPEHLRKTIPEGFNTSVYWNLGHVLTGTEFIVFGLSQQNVSIPAEYKAMFGYGTKATEWKEEATMPEWDTMVAQFKEQRERISDALKDRLEEPVPENMKKAEKIGELILAATTHMSNHNGVVAAMQQILKHQN